MTRTYYKSQLTIEMHCYQGNKCLCHFVFYIEHGYSYPRYHIENFGLVYPELNHELMRFINLVNKVKAFPRIDLNRLDDESFDLFLENPNNVL